jgi:ribosomal protein L11 methylase PrmA
VPRNAAPARALDVGTGTGVLAIALAKLGVKSVVALDLDPQAITAARGNVRRNAAGSRVSLACGRSRRRFPSTAARLSPRRRESLRRCARRARAARSPVARRSAAIS